ncbi:ribokinase [Bacillus sp. IB182487]|uniref:Ribokinase n=1 Tax=Metabacillus arenae TaxID=2771434 RepID=A0A926NM16_9BACI|nr:ribokinase [Metabacillus arenae]MBD1383098.1 ribokinase [Metabacillus arenae]
MKDPTITVIGSINMDLVVSVNRRPEKGETIKGEMFTTMPGGKGANQAVSAARLGAKVCMIGMVGEDEFGNELKSKLQKEHINVEGVESIAGISTGVAVITLADDDNSIVMISGANATVTPDYISKYEDLIANSDIVLTQLEIPLEAVEKAADICQKHNVPFILNPAPAQELPRSLLNKVTFITPNQIEWESIKADNKEIKKDKLIVTRGDEGVTFFEDEQDRRVSAFAIKPVDTTGAGDTFNGAFTYAIAKKDSLYRACVFGSAAAALSITQTGAQTGMPTKEDIDGFLKEWKAIQRGGENNE